MYVDDNEIVNHHLEVINDWLYLTNKLNTLKQEVKYIIKFRAWMNTIIT